MQTALDAVLITHQLASRARRAPDPMRENDALHAIVRDLADKPRQVLQLLVDVALDLCAAGSAGVTLRERGAAGEQLRSLMMAGRIADAAVATPAADESPCAVTLECGTPQLFARPWRRFAYLAELPIVIEELLVVPFQVDGDLHGTIWVASHDENRRFDAEDVRVMTALGDFTGATVHRLEVEAALRCSEERLRSVVDLAPALVTAVDHAGRVVIFNRACEELTGYAADDVIGGDLVDRLVPEPGQAAARRRLADDAPPLAVDETRWLTRAGQERVIAWRWFRVPGLVVGVGEDVTERRRSEDRLREQLLVGHAVGHHVAEAVFLTDAAGRVTFANHGAETLLGAMARELVGRPLHEVAHGRDGSGCARAACELPVIIEEAATPAHDDVFIRRDGSTVEVACSSARLDRGDGPGAIVIVRDVSARKRAERASARHASQLIALCAAAGAIHSLSLGDVLLGIAEQAREIIGAHQAMSTVVGRADGSPPLVSVSLSEKYGAWRAHDFRPDLSDLAELVCASNQPMRLTVEELAARDSRAAEAPGRPPRRGWLAAPLLDRDGSNLGLVELSDKYDGEFDAQDEALLVELAKMASAAIQNAQLYERGQTARTTAEAASAAKDEFLAMLAHELRNPLGVILNGVNVLERSESVSAPAAVRVRELIRHHTRHMARLLDDLLDLARVSQGKIHLRSEVMDLRAVVDITLQAYRERLEMRGQRLALTMPDAAVHVYGDPMRLQQVVGNLVDNASKFTPTGGSIALSVEEINDEVLVSVRDNGIGIPPGKLEAIFDLFTQLEPTAARTEGGLGIGLTLVRRLTEMHGGRVHAHSAGPGAGSEFIVRLRVVRRPFSAPVPAAPAARRSYQILVVEDNAAARDTLRFVLELEGHRVEVAADGPTAMEAADRQRPQVAFLDIGLPGVDGYEVARRLRAAHGPALRLFAVSGYGQPEDVRRALDAGFEGHLTKPVEIDEVLRILASL